MLDRDLIDGWEHAPALHQGDRPMTRVKKLEWEECRPGIWATGLVLGGEYRITLDGGKGFRISRGMFAIPDNRTWYPTLDAAKDAAQADYEARILACLEPPTVAEAARVLLGYELTPETEDAMSDAVDETDDGLWVDEDRGACVGSAALVNAWRAALRALSEEGKP